MCQNSHVIKFKEITKINGSLNKVWEVKKEGILRVYESNAKWLRRSRLKKKNEKQNSFLKKEKWDSIAK